MDETRSPKYPNEVVKHRIFVNSRSIDIYIRYAFNERRVVGSNHLGKIRFYRTQYNLQVN